MAARENIPARFAALMALAAQVNDSLDDTPNTATAPAEPPARADRTGPTT